MIGLGVGIDYSLFIVTRFRQLLHDGLSPRDAAAEAGASAGRAVIFAGLTVAISVTGLAFIGLDFVTKLGIGSALGVLTTVLIANSLLPAVLALLGHKVDRLKVPFLPQIDDSEAAREQTLDRPLGPVRHRARQGRLPGRAARCDPRARRDVGARAARRRRPGHAAEGADEPPGLRPARRGLRPGLQRPDPDRRRRQRRPAGAAADPRPRAGPAGRRVRRRAAVQRREDGRDRLRDARPPRRRTRRRTTSSTGCATTSCRRRSRAATRSPTSPARRRRSRTSPTGSWRGCRCSCSTSSASRSSCWRWRSARS